MKEEFYNLDSLFENMAAGKNYAYLAAKSTLQMENMFRKIKFPFHVVSAYGLNGRHFVLVQFDREVKRKTKE